MFEIKKYKYHGNIIFGYCTNPNFIKKTFILKRIEMKLQGAVWLALVCSFDKGGEHYDKQVLHKLGQQFVNP